MSQEDEDPYLRQKKYLFYRRLMWYTELALKSLNCNPYAGDLSEDVLNKFASLKSMLGYQKLLINVTSIVQRKIMFSKSVGLLAMKHLNFKQKTEQGIMNPRFLLNSYIFNFFDRSYIAKKTRFLKSLFEFSLSASNHRQSNKSKLFALKYFSNSLNRSFLDFYKKLKDNKSEQLAKIKVMFSALKQSNRTKLSKAFSKMTQHSELTKGQLISHQKLKERLPRLLAGNVWLLKLKALKRLTANNQQTQNRQTHVKILSKLTDKRYAEAFSSIARKSAAFKAKADFSKLLLFYRLKYASNRKLQSVITAMKTPKVEFQAQKSARLSLYQLLYSLKSKLLHSFQVLRNPSFRKNQIVLGFRQLVTTCERRNQMFERQFLNSISKRTSVQNSRYYALCKALHKIANRNLSTNLLLLNQIKGISASKLFAANKIGQLKLSSGEHNVGSLQLPCLLKLLSLLKNEERDTANKNLLATFDRYLVSRTAFEKNKSVLAMKRAQLKLENQTLKSQNNELVNREKFVNMWLRELNDKNRKINLDKSAELNESDSFLSTYKTAESKIDSLKSELEKLQNEKEHLKSEKRHLLEELKTANEEYYTRPNFNNFANSDNVETNVPNKSIMSQANIFQNGPGGSAERYDQRPLQKGPKRESVEMSGDESMIKKYAHDTPSPSINAKATPTMATRITDEVSIRRVLGKMLNEEKTNLEALINKAREERQLIKESEQKNRQTLQSLKETLESLEQAIVTKEMQLIDLQDKRGMIILEKAALKKNIEKAKKNLESLKLKIDHLETGSNKSEIRDSSIETIRTEYNEAFEQLKNNSAKIGSFEVRISQLADSQKILAKEINDSKTQKLELSKNLESLLSAQKEIEEELLAKDNQIHKFQTQLASLPADREDLESKRNFLFMHSKRFTLESDQRIPENILKELKSEIEKLQAELEERENEKGALIMQKFVLQKQRKKIFQQLLSTKSAVNKLEKSNPMTEDLAQKILIEKESVNNLMVQLEDQDKFIGDVDKKINALSAKEEGIKNEINALKADADAAEKGNQSDTFLSKDHLIMTFKNPNQFIDKSSGQPQANQDSQGPEQMRNPFNPRLDASFPSVMEMKKHVGEHIYEITKELTENSNRLDHQKQMITEIQQLLASRAKDMELLKAQSDFRKIRSTEQQNLLQTNCCRIVELRDEIIINNKLLLQNKRKMAQNNVLIGDLDQSLLSFSQKTIDTSRFIKTIDTSIQTELLENMLKPITAIPDSVDKLHRIQKNLVFSSDVDLIQTWLPKKFDLIISGAQNYFTIRADLGINPANMLVDVENNYSFDENEFKYIRRESYASQDDVEISGNYEDYFSHNTNNELNNGFNPNNMTPSSLNYMSYNFNHDQPELDFRPRKEIPLNLLNKKELREYPIESVKIFERQSDSVPALTNKFLLLQRQLNGVYKSKLSQYFGDLKITSSKIQLKRFLNALFNWKMSNLELKNEKLFNQAKRFKQGLFFLCHFAFQKQKLRAIDQVKLVSGLKKQSAFYKLLPVAIKGNMAQRKNLKDILHYWYQIKDDNRWFGRVMKGMIYKSSLDPQIALWRLRLYRKQTTTISPQLTKGLLYLIDFCQDKELDNTSRAFFKLSALIAPIEFSKEQTHISEYSNEQMSDYNSLEEDDNAASQIQESELESREKQKAQMIAKFVKLIQFSAAKHKKVTYKYFHLLERRALDPNLGKAKPAAETDQSLENDPNVVYLKNLQFIIEQNLKCKEELFSKNKYIELLRTKLDQKDKDLFALRNNFMFVYLDKVERICNRQFRLNKDFSQKLFFKNIK